MDSLHQEDLDAQSAHVRVLHDLCHAFASTTEAAQAAVATLGWVEEALDHSVAAVRLYVVDDGELVPAAGRGSTASFGRGALVRRAAETKRPVWDEARDGTARVAVPLISQGRLYGALRIVADAKMLRDRWLMLDAVASQAAIVLRHLEQLADYEQRRALQEDLLYLSRVVIRAPSVEEALTAIADFCWDQFHAPVVCWLTKSRERNLHFVHAEGLDRAAVQRVQKEIWTLPRLDTMTSDEIARLKAQLADVVGSDQVTLMDASLAIILIGTNPMEIDFLGTVEPLIVDAVQNLATRQLAEERLDKVDLGLALAAHELRGPLIASAALMEQLARLSVIGPSEQSVMREGARELTEVRKMCDSILEWSLGRESLHRRRTKLDRLVKDAVSSAVRGMGGNASRLIVEADSGGVVLVDRKHLHAAVSNLVRNALVYSPDSSPVEVTVRRGNGAFVVAVKDHGPGVPEQDRGLIFEPFMRGRNVSDRPGKGLGLYIARRVVEAHGGRISLETDPMGSRFVIALPASEPARAREVAPGDAPPKDFVVPVPGR